MNRTAALLLLAAVWPGPARGADYTLPTIPQVPAPSVQTAGATVPVGLGERVLGPIRERTGIAAHSGRTIGGCAACAPGAPACGTSVVAGSPVREWVGAHGGAGVPCGTSVCPGSPIKAWLCFHPTTGKALPKLNPHPYVGPIAGQFPCSSVAGYGCGPGGCGPGGCGRAGCVGGRGGCGPGGCHGGLRGALGAGKDTCPGFCTMPPEGSFPGYRFATPEVPSVVGKAGSPPVTLNTSYKPAVPPTGLTPAAARAPAAAPPQTPSSPTALEAIKRNLGRP